MAPLKGYKCILCSLKVPSAVFHIKVLKHNQVDIKCNGEIFYFITADDIEGVN